MLKLKAKDRVTFIYNKKPRDVIVDQVDKNKNGELYIIGKDTKTGFYKSFTIKKMSKVKVQ